MLNIGILVCNKLSYECCGAWCFKAFNEKNKGFEIYKDMNVNLYGFMHCNGCEKDFEKEMDYKLKQLKKCNVTRIHMALCVKSECEKYDELKLILKKRGFEVIYGTH